MFDIPDGNRVLFAYEKLSNKETLIGEVSFQHADKDLTTPGVPFDNEYFHQISFMFIKSDFQGLGMGRRLVSKALKLMDGHCSRPVRVQSAERAVGFFEKMDFALCQSEPLESLCGVHLFKYMYNMERPHGKPMLQR